MVRDPVTLGKSWDLSLGLIPPQGGSEEESGACPRSSQGGLTAYPFLEGQHST